MSEITVELRGLSGQVSLQVPEGSTVGDVRAAAGIDSDLSIRSSGQAVENDAPVNDEDILVTAPPAAKHGRK